MTQNAEILSYMKKNQSITPMDALKLGCFRLAARVYDLKLQGVRIESVLEERNGKRYSRYFLRG